jgi:hypothetical protein
MAGVIETSQPAFANGDQVTSAKLNGILTGSSFTADAVTGSTLAVDAGKLKVGTVTAAQMGASAVKTVAIEDGAVTAGKIGLGAVLTDKVGDLQITAGKLSADAVTTAKIANAAVTAAKLSGGQSGLAPVFGVRAYGSFNGAGTSPFTMIASGNVASVVRSSTGVYVVTLTEPMASTGYTVVANASAGATYAVNCFVTINTASQFLISTASTSGFYNSALVSFVVMQ